jgi:chromosomal replication initiator protein
MNIKLEIERLEKRKAMLRRFQKLTQEVTLLESTIKKNNQTLDELDERIQMVVCHDFGKDISDLCDNCRREDIVTPRSVIMYFLRTLSRHSLHEVGRAFKRNHGTAMHAIRRVEDRMATDPKFLDRITGLRLSISSQSKNGDKLTNDSNLATLIPQNKNIP